jgi:hypothetical protein
MSTFWNSQEIEIKRSYRWMGLINMMSGISNSVDYGPKPFLVKNFTRPAFTLNVEKVINTFTSESQLNTKYYTWDDTSISIMDIQQKDLNATNQIYNWLTSLGYQPEQDLNHLSRLFTNLYRPDKLTLTLQHIDDKGKPFEQWEILSAQPISINFGGEASYDNDEPVIITLAFAYVAARYSLIKQGGIPTPGGLATAI